MIPLAVPADLKFGADGLLPVVVQDQLGGDVLMVAWANAEALARTAESGLAHFWSRSRQSLWQKGETSGNRLHVRDLRTDCDRDTLLMVVQPEGPACHTGSRTCFGEDAATGAGVLAELAHVIESRRADRNEGSYTVKLLDEPDRALRKVGEEAVEVILAGKGESGERLAEESADLLYHLLVVLAARRVPLGDVLAVLAARRGAPRRA